MNINCSVTVLCVSFAAFQVPGIDNLGELYIFKRNIQFSGDFLLECLGYQVLASTNNVFHFSSVREGFELRF